jgi:NhaP-type Na+/H+ or K+/H+ antiporter
MSEPGVDPPRQVKTLQIIIAAMVVGVLALTVVGLAIGPVMDESQVDSIKGVLLGVCGALIVMGAVVGRVVRSVTMRALSRQEEDDFERRAVTVYTTMTIVSAAAAEGPAVLGGVAVLLLGPGISILFVAVPLALLVVQFPTLGRWDSFVYETKRDRNR